jgi:glutathione S-transferase
MHDITLIIGNKNYSSWSMRPWLALRHAGLPFAEQLINIYDPEMRARLAEFSPTGLVPVMKLDGTDIWDTLAIIERVHELAPEARLWPEDPVARSVARSVAAEMHSGFTGLRAVCPMNIRGRKANRARGEAVDKDVRRLNEVWAMCRAQYGARSGAGAGGSGSGSEVSGGPFLFGQFGAVDCMFAPVVTRLRTYAIGMQPVAQSYMEAVMSFPVFQEWEQAAITEVWTSDYDLVD